MQDNSQRQANGLTPRWVWALIVGLALLEPVIHIWLQWFPLPGGVATGLHTGDSHVYLHSMRALHTDFYSPYASAHAPLGMHSWRYYAVPAHMVYAALGGVTHLLHIPELVALGLLNGLSAALYLFGAWRFLQVAAPKVSKLAFALFALGGGPGGLLFLGTMAAGLHHAPSFEAVFMRYAQYDLIEGVHLWPALHFARLYYTLSLGLALLAGALLVDHINGRRRLLPAILLLLAAQWVNMRVGTLAFAVFAIYLYCRADVPLVKRIRAGSLLAVPILVGGLLTVLQLQYHPSYGLNQFDVVRESIWYSAFLSAGLFCLVFVPREMWRLIPVMSYWPRAAGLAMAGYLIAFTLLYGAYQFYWGNLWRIADTSVTVAVSDWALLGGVAGGLAGLLWRRRAERDESFRDNGWVLLWFLLFLSVGLSAWGGGWFMQFVPRRLLVLLGLPLATLAAQGIQRVHTSKPRVATGVAAAMLSAGVISILTGTLFFDGPITQKAGTGPFAYRHYHVMQAADREGLGALPPGRVLAPAYNPYSFTEVIALNPENPLVFGVGTLNHSDLPFVPMRIQVSHFFSSDTTADEREEFVRDWDADYVYCPATCPVPEEVRAQLAACPWLRLEATFGEGALYEVLTDE